MADKETEPRVPEAATIVATETVEMVESSAEQAPSAKDAADGSRDPATKEATTPAVAAEPSAGDPSTTGEATSPPTAEASKEDSDDEDEDLFGGDEDDEHPTATAKPASNDFIPSIPRKSPDKSTASASLSAPSSTNSSPAVHNKAGLRDGSSYGLPSVVKIPASVDARLLTGKLLESLKSLPDNLMNDALTEYDDAVGIKGHAIRNRGAYLFGVIKRYVSVHERSQSGEGEGILPMGEGLTPAVNERLEQLVATGFCSREEMNDKVKSKIRMLSEKDALFALDELASVERSSIRNFGSYFMGILNRYMRGDVVSKIKPPPSASGRGRDRSYRDGGPPPNVRDRSRDRFEPRRDSLDRRDDSRNYQQQERPPPQYDTRRQQQAQPWQNQPLPQNRPPIGPPGGGGGYPPPQQPYMPEQARPPPNVYQQQPYDPYASQGPPHHHQQQPPMMGQQAPSNYPYGGSPPPQQQQYSGSSQQYGGGSQPPYGGGPPGSYLPPQQQQPPPMIYGGNPPPQMPPQQSYPNTWQKAPPSGGMVDILGLADKAASAVQALASQNQASRSAGLPYMQQMPPYPPQQQQPPPYGSPPSMSGGMNGMPPQPSPMGYPPVNQSYQQVPPQQSPMYAGGGGGGGPADGFDGRRRTTATINDLPPSVQYAVQVSVSAVSVDSTQ